MSEPTAIYQTDQRCPNCDSGEVRAYHRSGDNDVVKCQCAKCLSAWDMKRDPVPHEECSGCGMDTKRLEYYGKTSFDPEDNHGPGFWLCPVCCRSSVWQYGHYSSSEKSIATIIAVGVNLILDSLDELKAAISEVKTNG